ncbi:hypothetical protein ACU741_003648 [Vibrio cholerae]
MFLLSRKESKLGYCLKASAVSFCSAGALAVIVDLLYGLPADGPDVGMTLVDVLGTVLVGPALETLLMTLILVLIAKFTDRIFLSACLCAFIFSVLHSMSHPLWGMFTFYVTPTLGHVYIHAICCFWGGISSMAAEFTKSRVHNSLFNSCASQ